MSASVTASSTPRRLARTATHTSRSGSAEPAYSTSSGRTPRTFASGPSTARITSASVISAAGPRKPVAALRPALAAHEPRVAQVDQDVLEELERDLLRLRDPLALDRARRRRRPARPSRGSRSRPSRRPSRASILPQRSNPSSRMRISHTSRKPSRARIGRDCAPACVTSDRRAARDRVLPARRDERAVGAPPARLRQRRAAEERHAVLAERRRSPARPARRRRTRGTSTSSGLRIDGGASVGTGMPNATAAICAATRRPRRRLAPDAPRRPAGAAAPAARSAPSRPRAARRRRRARARAAGRRGRPGVADEPTSHVQAVRPRARSCAWISARTSSSSSAREPEPLRDVPGRLVAAAHPQHVAVGDDPLVVGPERRVRVRVLGELEDGSSTISRTA